MSTISSGSPKEDETVPSDIIKVPFGDRIPFHPFFFAVHPILFLVSYNGGGLRDDGPLLLLICLAVTFLFGSLLYFLLRNARHAGLILTFWIILCFWTIPICDFLRTNLPIRIGQSVPQFCLLLYPIGTYFLWRLRGDFRLDTRRLNIISFLLVLFAVAGVGANELSVMGNVKSDETTFRNSESECESDGEERPDIYFIICDAYAGRHALKQRHHFDNTPFLTELENRGFQVVPNSSSNYPLTIQSIPSVLNMDYVDAFLPMELLKNREFYLKRLALSHVFDNKVIEFLRPLGYRYVLVMNGYQKVPITVKQPPEFVVSSTNDGEFHSLFYETTLLSVLLSQARIHQKTQRHETRTLLKLLKEMPEKYGSEPFFTYVHFYLPQEPYSFRADGSEQRPYARKSSFFHSKLTVREENEMYIEQVRFINDELLQTIDSLLSQSKREPIIVLMSDHGFRLDTEFTLEQKNKRTAEQENEEIALRDFNNLITIRLPNGKRLEDIEGMTNVNVFRAILNAVFGQNEAMLEPRYFTRKNVEATLDIRPTFERLKAASR